MKTPLLNLVKRLATATPASWFPACLSEATGYALQRVELAPALANGMAPREERLRARQIASCGALFAAPGYPPLGGLIVLPASDGLSPVTAADNLREQLAARGRRLLDEALADPRLVAHIDLGAAPTSIAGLAGLAFLRDRYALSVGHFLRNHGTPDSGDPRFDATSVCIQVAGLPANLVLWLAATVAGQVDAGQALVISEDEESAYLVERQRPLYAQIH